MAFLEIDRGSPSQDDEPDEDLFALRSSTLAALNSFLYEQAAATDALASLAAQSYPRTMADLRLVNAPPAPSSSLSTGSHESEDSSDTASLTQPCGLPVDEFKRVFKEDWQLSQFWYTQDTAKRLSQAIMELCPAKAQVAFVCCPTGYVAFKEIALPDQEILLLEYDSRFSIVAGTSFLHYDLDEPLSFPHAETLMGSQDVVIVDPPFHSEISQKKVALTIIHILRRGGRVVLLTGLTLSSQIEDIYPSPPFPKLTRRDIVIEHDGVGRLATPYGCWVGDDADGLGLEPTDYNFAIV